MQNSASSELYAIEKVLKELNNKALLEDWRKLTTSDHFYYMCTKYFNDGDVHKYFNPYDTPYESYINFMNILNDIILRMKTLIQGKNIVIELKDKYDVKHRITERPAKLINELRT
jgi:alpha-amylase